MHATTGGHRALDLPELPPRFHWTVRLISHDTATPFFDIAVKRRALLLFPITVRRATAPWSADLDRAGHGVEFAARKLVREHMDIVGDDGLADAERGELADRYRRTAMAPLSPEEHAAIARFREVRRERNRR